MPAVALIESGHFLCPEGRVSSIDDCQSPTPPDSINSDSLYVFNVGFTAPNSLGSVFSMPVLLETNDAKTPRFVIQVRGSTCLRDMENPTCGTCGNGAIDAMEACDDGNLDNEDGCRNDCTQPICGDGVRDGLEACDDGNEDDTDGCLSDCTLPRCGDGIVQAMEACDDGNEDDTDTCLTSCVSARCGNGVIESGIEACDDANLIETDGCRNDCSLARCGDGIVHLGVEACDDGNQDGERHLSQRLHARPLWRWSHTGLR